MGGAEIKFFEKIEKMLKKVEKIIFESHDKGKENTVVLQGTGRPRFFFFGRGIKRSKQKKRRPYWRTCDKAGAPVMIAFRQAMSYEMLRIVIIGFAKLKVEKAIIS